MFAQFDKNYTPIAFEGSIPSVFIENPFETTENDITQRNKDVLTKAQSEEFYTLTNCNISDLFLSGAVYFNDDLTRYVNKVADQLLRNKIQRKDIQVYVTKFDLPNATTWHNGSIFVNIGLLRRLENEAQLAFVLAHEMTHFYQKHNLQQYKKSKHLESHVHAHNSNERLFERLEYAREHEFEADVLGLEFLMTSSYDARESIRVLEILKTADSDIYTQNLDLQHFVNIGEYQLSDYMLCGQKELEQDSLFLTSKKMLLNKKNAEKQQTHPAIEKRISKLKFLLEKYDNKDKKKQLLDTPFAQIQQQAAFELLAKYMSENNYVRSLYESLRLMEQFPTNLYLNETAATSVYWLAHYKKTNSLHNILPNSHLYYQQAYGNFLCTLSQLTTYDYVSLATDFIEAKYIFFPENEILLIQKARVLELNGRFHEAYFLYKMYINKYPKGKHFIFAKKKVT
ncbi:MAG: M48 family metallopeptidase [Chitinophagales bacterium]